MIVCNRYFLKTDKVIVLLSNGIRISHTLKYNQGIHRALAACDNIFSQLCEKELFNISNQSVRSVAGQQMVPYDC